MMAQINVSAPVLQDWYDVGVSRGATSMSVVTDTFPYEPKQYPMYLMPGQEVHPLEAMEIEGHVFRLTIPLAQQLPVPKTCGCTRDGPCNCG